MEAKQLLDTIMEIVRPKLKVTLAGAIELSAYPIETIKIVIAAFQPKPTGSAYALFKKQLNAYSTATGIKPSWKEMYQLRDAFGISQGAPKEESLKGSTSESTSPSTVFMQSNGRVHKLNPSKYTKPDYSKLYHTFEKERTEGYQSATTPNPFTFRKHQQEIATQEGIDYAADQRDIRQGLLENDAPTMQMEYIKFEHARHQGKLAPGFETMPNPFGDKSAALTFIADPINYNKIQPQANDSVVVGVNDQPTDFVAKKENLEAFEKAREQLNNKKPEKEAEQEQKASVKLEILSTIGQFLTEHHAKKQDQSTYFKALSQTAEPVYDQPQSDRDSPVDKKTTFQEAPFADHASQASMFDDPTQWEEIVTTPKKPKLPF